MKFPNWSARERRLAVVVAMLISVWAAAVWIAQPLWNRFTDVYQQAAVSRTKLMRLRELARRAPAIEQTYQRYVDRLSTEPPALLQRQLLNELEQLAREASVQINLKPRPVGEDGQVDRLQVELDVDAPQAALLAFLDTLFSSASLIDVERLRISTTASKEYPLRATMLVNRAVVRP